MSHKNEKRYDLSRESCDTFSEVSAFLGGIFFTALLILVQQREKFDIALLEIELEGSFTIRFSELHIIAIPVSISVILFVFSAIFFATAYGQNQA